jgi:hypothetical protein
MPRSEGIRDIKRH